MSKKIKRKLSIMVVEDNETMRAGMVEVLKKDGHTVFEADWADSGLVHFQSKSVDLVITDYKMTGMDGLDLLKKIKKEYPSIEVIVITAFGTIELVVEAMKAGAWDFISKPFSKDEILLKVNRLSEMIQERDKYHRLADENAYLRAEVDVRLNYGEIVGESNAMKTIYETVKKVAESDSSVLIYGESGTGKELIARAIHYQSARKSSPFVRVNCGALAEGILESELFGHEKGAYTGAVRQKRGRFELADQGTLFLDEIGDIPLSTQVKLLRVLQEKEFERVGGEETIRVDVRILAATHRNLKKEVNQGTFREDLFYRLHILPMEIPPLRERKEDIPLLVNHFIQGIGSEMRKQELKISREAMDVLLAYNWPGNVRELENVIERAIVLSEQSELTTESFCFLMPVSEGTEIAEESMNLESNLASLERRLLIQALKVSKGVKARAARLLDIKEGAFYYKLKKYGLIENE